MVHKKYTYKNGKRYGPYLYETKRANGKIVTTYLGLASENSMNNGKGTFNPFPILIILGLILVVSFLFLYFPIEFTGRATLDIQANYEVGELITGNLNLNIKSGELIPQDSMIVISLGEVVKEIFLSELVSVNVSEGEFYAEGFEISGEGNGFGLIGGKTIYPEIEFDLKVFNSVETDSSGNSFSEEVEEIVEENETEAETAEANETEEVDETIEEVQEGEEAVEEVQEVEEEIQEEIQEESPSEPEESSSALITGEVILEDERIISGVVGFENEFSYVLSEGESAEIVEGSLSVEEAEMSLEVVEGIAKITTDYLEIVEGFGEEFLVEESLVLKIDISEFGLIAEESSELKIELVYGENILAEKEKDISVEEIVEFVNETLSNETIVANVTVNTIQYGAILGKPVRWKKKIELSEASELSVELPSVASNISITKIVKTEVEEEIIVEDNETTEEVVEEEESIVPEVEEDSEALEDAVSPLTGLVTIEVSDEVVNEMKDNSTKEEGIVLVEFDEIIEEVEIEYDTPAPYAEEEEEKVDRKIVKIVGPEEVHYENVLAFTELNEDYGIINAQQIRINWVENGTYLQPSLVADLNENGIYDYVEWIVPHLSNQTFEIIVVIRAEHLDENRTSISDIYEEVKELDGNWSETIPEEHYVRIVFEKNLTSDKDITIYPRIVNGNPKVEVYEIDGTELIAEFVSINSEELNKIYLTSLNGEQDTFDLKVVGGSLEFDYIVDPTDYFFEDCVSISEWTATSWVATHNECLCNGCTSTDNMSLTSSLDLSGTATANLSFDWVTQNFASGDFLKIYASSNGGINYTEVFSQADSSSSATAELKLEDYITLNSNVRLMGSCKSHASGVKVPKCKWDSINVTGYDFVVPEVTINVPTASTYSSASFAFNVTLDENGSVMFSLDGGTTNYTMDSTDNQNFNYTNSSIPDGSHTFQVYANDTEGNDNHTESVDFIVDTIAPTVTINVPANITYGWNNVSMGFNVTLGESGSVMFSLDGGATNTTMSTLDNQTFYYTNSSMIEGSYTFQVYADDTEGNINYSISNVFTLNNSLVYNCGTLSDAGRNYYLQNDISTTGDCFIISADNITFDGGNYNVDGDDDVGDHGINSTDVIGLTLKNFNFTDFETGFYLDNVNDSIIKDNHVSSMYGVKAGIYLTNSENNTINNNTIFDSFLNISDGITLSSSSLNNVSGNNLSGFLNRGIYVTRGFPHLSQNNTLESNVISNIDGYGIHLAGLAGTAGYNVVQDNNLTNTKEIRISGEINDDSLRNRIINSKTSGIVLSSTTGKTDIINNTIFNSTDYGVKFNKLSDNSLIKGGNISLSGKSAIFLDESSSDGPDNITIENITLENTNSGYYDLEYVDSSGDTEDLTTLIDMLNIGNYSFDEDFKLLLTVKETGLGEIKFLEVVNGSGTNLTGDIQIADNFVYVNSSSNSGLNKSANVTLYGTPAGSLSNPEILRDGESCSSDVCYNFTALTAATVVFNVTGWSNYTIGDKTGPEVTINVPTASTYSSASFAFNVTLDENGSVMFSLDGGTTNYTMDSTDNQNFNYTNSSIPDGSHTFQVYANDTEGNDNHTESVDFIVDTIAPTVTINVPANITYGWNNVSMGFNVTLGESGSVMFSLDGGATNTTMSTLDNQTFYYTNSSMIEGSYTFQVYADDTEGNINYSISNVFTLNNSLVYNCGTLSDAGRNYYLQNDISTTGDCFIISADNITFDGGNYNVDGDDDVGDHGINSTDVIGLTLKNFNFTDFETGFYLDNVNDSIIKDNHVSSMYGVKAGIYLTNSENNTINNNTIFDSFLNISDGITLSSSSLNNVSGNNLSGFLNRGIYVTRGFPHLSQNNTLESNVISNIDGYGIHLAGLAGTAGYNVVQDNNLTNTKEIRISGEINDDSLRNRIINSKTSGIVLSSTTGKTDIINNTIFNSTDYGVKFNKLSDNSLIKGGNISLSGKSAIFLDESSSDGPDNITIENITLENTNSGYYDLEYVDSSGDTEDLTTLIDMLNIGNYSFDEDFKLLLTVKETGLGEIKFLEVVNGSGTNLTGDIQIADNFVYVNSSSNSGLNKSANVTLYGTPAGSLSNPEILRDGESCSSDVCYNFTALTAATVVFNVTGWSNYTIGDKTGPEVTINVPENKTYTTSSFDFSVSLNENGSVMFSLETPEPSPTANITMDTTDNQIFNYSTTLSDGTYTFKVYADDTLGNKNHTENVTFTVAVPEEASPPRSGGGGSAAVSAYPLGFSVSPSSLAISIIEGETEERTVEITNNNEKGTIPVVVEVSVIEDILKLSDRGFSLEGGESRIIKLTINNVKRGIHVGEIQFTSGIFKKKIKVSLNVRSDNILFDSSLAIGKEKEVERGKDIVAQININQIGKEKKKKEVTVNLVIKNYEGIIYLEETYVLDVFDEAEFLKNLPTQNLPPGDYIIGIDVSSLGTYETSSSQFKVKEEISETSKRKNILLIVAISSALSILLVLYFLFVRRKGIKKVLKYRKVK